MRNLMRAGGRDKRREEAASAFIRSCFGPVARSGCTSCLKTEVLTLYYVHFPPTKSESPIVRYSACRRPLFTELLPGLSRQDCPIGFQGRPGLVGCQRGRPAPGPQDS